VRERLAGGIEVPTDEQGCQWPSHTEVQEPAFQRSEQSTLPAEVARVDPAHEQLEVLVHHLDEEDFQVSQRGGDQVGEISED
jgi:hypothetical protein